MSISPKVMRSRRGESLWRGTGQTRSQLRFFWFSSQFVWFKLLTLGERMGKGCLIWAGMENQAVGPPDPSTWKQHYHSWFTSEFPEKLVWMDSRTTILHTPCHHSPIELVFFADDVHIATMPYPVFDPRPLPQKLPSGGFLMSDVPPNHPFIDWFSMK